MIWDFSQYKNVVPMKKNTTICMTNLYYKNAKFETFPNLESPSNLGVEENVRI